MIEATDATSTSSITLLITTIGGLLATGLTAWFSERRRQQDRAWQAQDRADHAQQIRSAIAENTEVSVKAFNEANGVHLKIAAMAGNKDALEELGRRALKTPQE